jgi:hypothetical protein
MKKTGLFRLVVLVATCSLLAVGCDPIVSSSSSSSSSSSTSSSTSSVYTEEKENLLGDWADGGQNVYTLSTNTTSKLEVSYEKTEAMTDVQWSYFGKTLGGDYSSYKTLRFTVSGNAILKIKLEKGSEAREVDIAVTGIEAAYEWNLMADGAFLNGLAKIVIFGAPGKATGSGNAAFTKFEFTTDTAEGQIINTGFNNVPTNINEYNGTDATFSFNQKWEDNGDNVYTISYEGSTLVAAYDKKTFTYPYIASNVFGPFGNFDYITIKASGTKDNRVLVKAADGVEVTYKFAQDNTVELFVLDISKMTVDARNSIKKILVFAEPGSAEKIGTFKIHEAYFTKVNEAPTVEPEVNVYDGTGETFDINRNWHDGGAKDYTVTQDGTDTVLTYTKSDTYTFAKTLIEGNFGDFKYIVFKLQGAVDKQVLAKVEYGSNKVEKTFKFTGEVDEFVLDITSLSVDTRNNLKSVMLFAAPGTPGVSGTITIKEAYFTNTADVEIPEIQINEYLGIGREFGINQYWKDGGDGVYTVSNVDGVTVATFDKGDKEWPSMKTLVNGRLSDFASINFGIEGAAGTRVLVKAGNAANVEKWVDLDGTVQNITMDLSGVSAANLDSLKEILIFATPGVAGTTGTLKIHWMAFKRPTAVDDGVSDTFVVPHKWFDDGSNVATVTNGETATTVVYAKDGGDDWACVMTYISGDFSRFSSVVFNLQSDVETSILLKVEGAGAKQLQVTIGTTAADYTLDISTFAGRTGINAVVIFAQPGVGSGVSGTYTINSVTFVK